MSETNPSSLPEPTGARKPGPQPFSIANVAPPPPAPSRKGMRRVASGESGTEDDCAGASSPFPSSGGAAGGTPKRSAQRRVLKSAKAVHGAHGALGTAASAPRLSFRHHHHATRHGPALRFVVDVPKETLATHVDPRGAMGGGGGQRKVSCVARSGTARGSGAIAGPSRGSAIAAGGVDTVATPVGSNSFSMTVPPIAHSTFQNPVSRVSAAELPSKPCFAGVAEKSPLGGLAFVMPPTTETPSVFSFSRQRRGLDSAAAASAPAGGANNGSSERDDSRSLSPSPNATASSGPRFPCASPSPPIAFATSAASTLSSVPPLDLGGPALLATGETWRCEACGKPKDLAGAHLIDKDVVRSDCWPCARKRFFHRTRSTLAPVTTPILLAESGPVAAAAAVPDAPHLPPAGLPPAAAAATTTAPTLVVPAIRAWVCQSCGKQKDLSGPHLDGKLTVRSDCWPCAKKRTFELRHVAASNLAVVPQAVATSAAPALTQAVVAASAAASALGSTTQSPIVIPIAPFFTAKAVSSTAMLHAKNPDADACGFTGLWDEAAFTRDVLRLRSALLMVRAGHLSSTDGENPLSHLFDAGRTVLSNGGIRVFTGGDDAIYAQRSDMRYCGGGSGDGNAAKTIGLEHLALLAQIALDAEALASSRGKRVGRVFCNNSTTFAALSAYFAIVAGDSKNPHRVEVWGPARDPTIRRGALDEIAGAYGGREAVVSVNAKLEAVRIAHRLTQIVVTPNGATAFAIREYVRAHLAQTAHPDPSSSLDVVLLGKVAPWSDAAGGV